MGLEQPAEVRRLTRDAIHRIAAACRHVSQSYCKHDKPKWLRTMLDLPAAELPVSLPKIVGAHKFSEPKNVRSPNNLGAQNF